MRFQAIYFDLFNTLLHFDPTRLPEVEHGGQKLRTTTLKVFETVRRKFDVRCDYSEFLKEFSRVGEKIERLKARGREYPSRKRFELLCRRLGIESEEAPSLMVKLHMDQMFSMVYLPRPNRMVMERLSHYPKFVGSNFDHAATARRALTSHGLMELVEAVFISEEVGWVKPSREFFGHVTQATGHEPARCLWVGDDPQADCEGAARAGFQTAWLRADASQPPPARPPDWIIGALDELLEICG